MRLRDLGLFVGGMAPGPLNAITDVPRVEVGQASWITDHPAIQRSGVTVIYPGRDMYQRPCYAATDILNGFGELTGQATIDEWGIVASPIVLTNTRSVGNGYEAIYEHFFSIPEEELDDDALPLPVVGECDDSFLNDSRHPNPMEIFRQAFRDVSSGPVAEGAVGAGSGMHLFGYKGGIGTSSRQVRIYGQSYMVGVLVNTNFGRPYQLRLKAGLEMYQPPQDVPRDGSCIGVVATDAPVWPHELKRLARRIGMGLARTGSVGNDTSGEIFLAFSTAERHQYAEVANAGGQFTGRHDGDAAPMTLLFDAVTDCAEEAVWNALLAAGTVHGVDGHVLQGFHQPDNH